MTTATQRWIETAGDGALEVERLVAAARVAVENAEIVMTPWYTDRYEVPGQAIDLLSILVDEYDSRA